MGEAAQPVTLVLWLQCPSSDTVFHCTSVCCGQHAGKGGEDCIALGKNSVLSPK